MQALLYITLIVLASSAQAARLQDMLKIYQDSSPSLQAENARIESLRAQARAAGAYPAPELGIEWGSRAVSPGMSDETMYYQGLLIGQEFMYPGKISAMRRAEESRVRMAQADSQATTRAESFRIAALYLEIQMIQQRRVVLDSAMRVLGSLQESARRSLATGMTGMEDLFRLQAEHAKLRSDSLSLAGEEQAMGAMLAGVLGSNEPLSWPTAISFDPAPIPAPDSLLRLAQARPELASMQQGKQMAQSEAEAARLRKMPDLMVQGRYMRMMGPDEWSLMLGVQVPIAPWSISQSRASLAAAQARKREVQDRTRGMAQMIAQDLRANLARYQTAQARLQQIRQERIVTAQSALRASITAYGSGRSELTMVLDGLRMLLMAREEETMAQNTFFQALLALENAAGTSPLTWLHETTSEQGSHP